MGKSIVRGCIILGVVAQGCLTAAIAADYSTKSSVPPAQSNSAPAIGPDAQRLALNPSLVHTNVAFIGNDGQADERVKFYARILGGVVFVTDRAEIVYSLSSKNSSKAVAFKEELLDAQRGEARGAQKTSIKISSFKGNDPTKWNGDLSSYDVVDLGQVYRGVELKLKAHPNRVEKLFFVRPGADPGAIQLRLSGAAGLHVNSGGELEATTEFGAINFSKPVAFQEFRGERKYVEVAYAVSGDKYGFSLGAYDRSRELVIDPTLLSTFLGGDGSDSARMVIDGNNDVILFGQTGSSDFPTTVGVYDSTSNDMFIAKLDASLTTLLAATFLGGTGSDNPGFHDVDALGNVYVAANTLSSDFPTTAGAYDRSLNGPGTSDIVVAKLNSSLTALLASTYIGGSGAEGGGGWGDPVVKVDTDGEVVVTAFSNSADYPTTVGAYDRTYNDFNTDDVVISKFDSNLTTLLASTFIGGSVWDVVYNMTLDTDGNVYVVGRTSSSNYPITAGAYHANYSDPFPNYDGFISKLSNDLTTLIGSTYLGSTGSDIIWGVEPGPDGSVYVAGYSNMASFPTTAGAYDTSYNGGTLDGFVAQLNSTLTTLEASTFLGGSAQESISSCTVDTAGDVHVGGNSWSSNFPTTPDSFDNTLGGDSDGVYAVMSGDLTTLRYGTFVGGSATDGVGEPQINSMGEVYLVGGTQSGDFPTTPGAYDTTPSAGGDVFVMRIGGVNEPGPTPLCCDCPAPVPPSGYMCFEALTAQECAADGCIPLPDSTCDPASGACVECFDSTDCDDDNVCTDDTCDAGSNCVHQFVSGPVLCAFGSSVHTVNENSHLDSGNDSRASVATDGAGTWMSVWHSKDSLGGTIGTDNDIVFAISTDGAASWTAPAAVSTNATRDKAGDARAKVATDGMGTWIVTWTSRHNLRRTIGNDFDILHAVTTDAGATWTDPAPVNSNAAGIDASDRLADIETDGAGRWIVAWQTKATLGGLLGADLDIAYSVSTDDGATWSAVTPLNADAVTNAARDARVDVETDGAGTWLVVWDSKDSLGGTINTDPDILAARSTDGGATWSGSAAVNSYAPTPSSKDMFAQLATNGAGTWIAAWASKATLGDTLNSDFDIIYATSSDAGLSWSAAAPLNTTAAGPASLDTAPVIESVGPDAWAAAWHSRDSLARDVGGDEDVLCAFSYDSGTTWTQPEPLHANATADSGKDLFPSLATDGRGTILAAWHSDDTLGEGLGADYDILASTAACECAATTTSTTTTTTTTSTSTSTSTMKIVTTPLPPDR